MEQKTDVVAKFNQIVHQTKTTRGSQDPDKQGPVKNVWRRSLEYGQWIQKFEQFTFKFLQYIFKRPLHSKLSVGPASSASLLVSRQMNELLDQITKIETQMDPDNIASILPFMANLTFLKDQDFRRLQTNELLNMLKVFEKTTTTMEYRQLTLDLQLRKLIDFVDNIRRLAEFLMKSAGSVNQRGGFLMTSQRNTRQISVENNTNKTPSHLSSSTIRSRNKIIKANISTQVDDATTFNNKLMEASTFKNELGKSITFNNELGKATDSNNKLGKATNSTNKLGTATNSNNKLGKATDSKNICKLAASAIASSTSNITVTLKTTKSTQADHTTSNNNLHRKRCGPRICPKEPGRNDKWCPLVVKGVGITDVFPSLTHFENIRELNVPGEKIFDIPQKCIFEPPKPEAPKLKTKKRKCKKH